MNTGKYSNETLAIANAFKILKNPIRLHILKVLSEKNSCCYSNEISDQLNISPSTLSQHLKELRYAGLIKGEVQSPYIKYCINKVNWEKSKELINKFFEQKIEVICNK